jgi:hypothetical protein
MKKSCPFFSFNNINLYEIFMLLSIFLWHYDVVKINIEFFYVMMKNVRKYYIVEALRYYSGVKSNGRTKAQA